MDMFEMVDDVPRLNVHEKEHLRCRQKISPSWSLGSSDRIRPQTIVSWFFSKRSQLQVLLAGVKMAI